MKKLIVAVFALLMTACAAAEGLDLSVYGDYTGEALEGSAEKIQYIMEASDELAAVETSGGIRTTVYVPEGEKMRFVRAEEAAIVGGFEIRRLVEETDVDIYVDMAGGVTYMIENGAIYTMPVENLPITLSPIDALVFVYDENEVVLGTRTWDNGEVVLARAEDMWLEYYLDESGFICVIKTYEGAESPECTAYITVEKIPAFEVPSFILREAAK